MTSFLRRLRIVALLLAAIWLAACSSEEPTPEPTVTKTRPPTFTAVPATAVLPTAPPTPSPIPIAAVGNTTPRPGATTAPKAAPAGRDPILPIFGPFPPRPIPARPDNINPLTGLAANPAMLQRRPLVVRIGNDEKVRTSEWQAGLTQADLVFEELIDILGSSYANTRYSAVFLANDPPLIGPVRSGRVINFQIVPMVDGALAHAGASNGTRWLFSQTPMVNIDEYFNMPAYCYDKSHGYQGRLYTTGPRLREWLAQKKWEKAVPLYGFNFSDAPPAGQAVTSISLTKSPWPRWAQVEWRYDAGKGKYMRYVTGAPLIDLYFSVTAKWGNGADCIKGGGVVKSQVSAANVVVLYARHDKTSIVEDSNNAVSVYIPLLGQGDAHFFRDGVMTAGKWQRQSEQEFFNFTDTAGRPLALKPGTTWFEIAPLGFKIDTK